MKLTSLLKKNSRVILTMVSVVGVVATAVTAAKATPKALELVKKKEEEKRAELDIVEKVKTMAPEYLCSALFGSVTVASILCANKIDGKAIAALTASGTAVRGYLKKYRDEVVKMFGTEVDEELNDKVCKKYADYHITDSDIPDKKLIFVEPITGQRFERYEREVIDAEYHLNRNYTLRGGACVNEFLEFLGIEPAVRGDNFGWSMESGVYWVDFEHHLKKINGEEVVEIEYVFYPDDDFDEY